MTQRVAVSGGDGAPVLWSAPPRTSRLAAGEVHVWRLNPSPASDPGAAWGLLAADERARAERYVFDRDRAAFVQRRAALRGVLARYLGADPAALRFSYGEHGKPALTGPHARAGLAFNVAHSGVALLAVARGGRLGVDIEARRRLANRDIIAAREFAEDEQKALAALPAARRQVAFFRLWAVKEACLKALGTGLSLAPSEIVCDLDDEDWPRLRALPDWAGDPAGWTVCSLVPTSGHAAAFAIDAAAVRVRLWNAAADLPSRVP